MKIKPTEKQIKKVLAQLERNKAKLSAQVGKIKAKLIPSNLHEAGELLGVSHEQVRNYQKKYESK